MSLTKTQTEKVEEIVKEHTESEKRKREKRMEKHIKTVIRLSTIPIALGAIAAVIFIYYYGLREFAKIALSWTIGIMLIATISTGIINKFKHI